MPVRLRLRLRLSPCPRACACACRGTKLGGVSACVGRGAVSHPCCRVLSNPDPTNRKFGLLACEHPFCLPCIRGWRQTGEADTETVGSCRWLPSSCLKSPPLAAADPTLCPGPDCTHASPPPTPECLFPCPCPQAVRTCPLCRQPSHFITPSRYWPQSAGEKADIQDRYRAKLATVDCMWVPAGPQSRSQAHSAHACIPACPGTGFPPRSAPPPRAAAAPAGTLTLATAPAPLAPAASTSTPTGTGAWRWVRRCGRGLGGLLPGRAPGGGRAAAGEGGGA